MKEYLRYDFDELTDRRNSGSMKWDEEGDDADVIQMWVADMDFRTAPSIVEALRKRVDTGIFGYTYVSDSYYESLIRWNIERHGWEIRRESVIYTSGVVPALSAIIKAMTSPGDGVILQTPAYNCFFSSIRNNKCRMVENPLKRVDTALGFTYEIDFDQLETLAAHPSSTLMILCNPHNPSGRVWSREELMKVRDICHRNGVRVVSDEIHCELVHPGDRKYIPYATIDPEAIVCISPSKAFNTAGLQIANIVTPDEQVRSRIDRAINDNEVCDVNPFGVIGLQAAYNEGREWLKELNSYLYSNYQLLRDSLNKRDFPDLQICESEATYLAWIDVSGFMINGPKATGDEIEKLLLEKARVRVASGSTYGAPDFIRLNYACPRPRLAEAIARIQKTLNTLE